LEERTVAGITTWEGELMVAPNELVVPGQMYVLELDDGRAGEIIILKIKQTTPSAATYLFSGLGSLD
jgi:hypothetical protein